MGNISYRFSSYKRTAIIFRGKLEINFKGDVASPTKYLKDNLCKRITLHEYRQASCYILPSHCDMKSRLCFNNQVLVSEK